MAHCIPSMIVLAPMTRELFRTLPDEFTKKQFEEMRDKLSDHAYPYGAAICFQTCREYGFIEVVRTEPCTYTKKCEIYVNPQTGEKLDIDQIDDLWSKKLAREFGLTFHNYSPERWDLRRFAEDGEVTKQGYRNIFRVNYEKFKDYVK